MSQGSFFMQSQWPYWQHFECPCTCLVNAWAMPNVFRTHHIEKPFRDSSCVSAKVLYSWMICCTLPHSKHILDIFLHDTRGLSAFWIWLYIDHIVMVHLPSHSLCLLFLNELSRSNPKTKFEFVIYAQQKRPNHSETLNELLTDQPRSQPNIFFGGGGKLLL